MGITQTFITYYNVRKVAMYLIKCLYDLRFQETAVHSGVESYSVVGWAWAQVQAEPGRDDVGA